MIRGGEFGITLEPPPVAIPSATRNLRLAKIPAGDYSSSLGFLGLTPGSVQLTVTRRFLLPQYP
jgi:hypothetical protein